MVGLGDVLAALAPWTPEIVVLLLAVVLYWEAKGAWRRWGSTAERSAWGKASLLALVTVGALALLFSGWVLYGSLLLVAVLLGALWWTLSRRHARH